MSISKLNWDFHTKPHSYQKYDTGVLGWTNTPQIYWLCLCVLPPAVLSELATGSTDSELLWQIRFPNISKLCRGQRLLPPTDKLWEYMERKLDLKVSLKQDVYLKTHWLSHSPVWKPQICPNKMKLSPVCFLVFVFIITTPFFILVIAFACAFPVL